MDAVVEKIKIVISTRAHATGQVIDVRGAKGATLHSNASFSIRVSRINRVGQDTNQTAPLQSYVVTKMSDLRCSDWLTSFYNLR